MDAFKKRLWEMSIAFGESTETLSKGLYDILSASVPAEKALDVLAVTARAAKAGLIDTWPEAYMFCLLTARDRGEIEKIDCYRYDFSGIKLRGVDLRNSSFDCCKFDASSLEDCWFDGSSLRNCNFNRANLYNAKFRDCDLTGASFRQANLFHADFSRANLTGAVTHLAQIGYTVLKDAKLDQGQAIEFPKDIEAVVTHLQDAGYAIVSGSQNAHDPISTWELDADGETVETNYHGYKHSDSV